MNTFKRLVKYDSGSYTATIQRFSKGDTLLNSAAYSTCGEKALRKLLQSIIHKIEEAPGEESTSEQTAAKLGALIEDVNDNIRVVTADGCPALSAAVKFVCLPADTYYTVKIQGIPDIKEV